MEFQTFFSVAQQSLFAQVWPLSNSETHKLIALETEHFHWLQTTEACRVQSIYNSLSH